MHTINAVLLDLDGTLLDSVPDLAIAANAIRRDLGMAQLPEALVATFVGKGVDNLVRRALAGSLMAQRPTKRCSHADACRSSSTTTRSMARTPPCSTG